MSRYHKNKDYTRRGFSLFEMLLTVGVAATFFVFLFNIGQTIARNQAVNAASNYVEDIEDAVDLVLSDPVRFGNLYAAVLASGNIAQASVTDLKAGSGVLSFLNANELLNSAFPTEGPFGQEFMVIFRIPPAAIANSKQAIESFVVSDTLLADELVRNIAGAIDGTGGALRDSAAVASSTIKGAYGAWEVPASVLTATSWYTGISAASPPTLQNGGYVVSYNYYDLDRSAKDYLMRVGGVDPSLNTMYADLSMGNYNVLGADNVTGAGGLTTNELIIEGTSRFANAPTINGELQSDGPLVIGNINSSGGSAQMAVDDGQVIVTNATNSEQAVVSDRLTTNIFDASELTAQNVTASGNAFSVNSSSGINASAASGGGLTVTGTANITGQVQSSAFGSNSLRLTNGDIGAIQVQVTGDLDQNSGDTVADQYIGGGRTRSSTANWPCAEGC